MGLTPVDTLEVQVLVDNVIEWFSALPEGFVHEAPQHIPRAEKDPISGLPLLDFENYCCGAHGLAILIASLLISKRCSAETLQKTTIDGVEHQVLLDAGPEGLTIERNVQALLVKLEDLDALVLSHWHCDHSGGILRALEMRNNTPGLPALKVDLHPDRPVRRGIAPPPEYKPRVALNPDPTFDEIHERNGVVDLHPEAHEVVGRDGLPTGIGVSGEIPRWSRFERGIPGAVTWKEEDGEAGWFTDELIMDERYVVVDVKGKGLVVFSSCSHAGICNVLRDAQTRYDRPVHMVVGGLHLVPTAMQPVKDTIDFLARRIHPRPKYVLPLHCTGLEARGLIREALGEGCVPAGVGMKVVIQGDEAAEAALDELELKVID